MAGAYTKLLDYFKSNVGRELDRNTLSKVAGVYDWARVIRQLRQDGYDVETLKDGYILNSLSQVKKISRVPINRKLRYEVLSKYSFTCQSCGKSVKDGVKLDVDHIIPVDLGGTNDIENLWVLCEECNEGKKNFFKDENPEILKEVLKEKSGKQRLKKYILLNPYKPLKPLTLQIISGVREWTRELRYIRQEMGINLKWYPKKKYYFYEAKPSKEF